MLQSQKGNRSQTRLIDSSTSARLSGFVALLPASHVTVARNAPTSAKPAAASRMNKPAAMPIANHKSQASDTERA